MPDNSIENAIENAIDRFLADPAARSAGGGGNQIPGCDVPVTHPRYEEVVTEAKRRAKEDADRREQAAGALLRRPWAWD